MDMLHCMRCGHAPHLFSEVRLRYFMTSCFHLMCEKCSPCAVTTSGGVKCTICSGECKILEITQQTCSELKTYFTDPVHLIKESLQKVFQPLQFQHHLHKSFIRNMGKLADNLKALKTENGVLKMELASVRELNVTMTNRLKDMEKQLNEYEERFKQKDMFEMTPLNSQNLVNLIRGDQQQSVRPNVEIRPNEHLQEEPPPRSSGEGRTVTSLSSSRSHVPMSQNYARPEFIPFSLGPVGSSVAGENTPRRSSEALYMHRSSVRVSPAFSTPATPSGMGSLFQRGETPLSAASPRPPFAASLAPRNDLNLSSSSDTPNFIRRLRNLHCRL